MRFLWLAFQRYCVDYVPFRCPVKFLNLVWSAVFKTSKDTDVAATVENLDFDQDLFGGRFCFGSACLVLPRTRRDNAVLKSPIYVCIQPSLHPSILLIVLEEHFYIKIVVEGESETSKIGRCLLHSLF
jgi:hypothetical protein